MSNRLAQSTSPYLLQHKDNPVDWFEWGPEPFELAQRTDRPILLSVGYSACHWCHVMAHESFEDDDTAAYMNEHFVNIKVDREERPDVDRIYMDALQVMSGHGGWPMTAFLTPTGEPFFAGTYYPKEARGHMPSFRQLMASIINAWTTKRESIDDQAGRLAAVVSAGMPAEAPPLAAKAAGDAVELLADSFDPEWGGFGGAPKFPQAPVLEFLLRRLVLDPPSRAAIEPILRTTLDSMRAGGIYDQIGGGFARYSVDREWLIPHFEKMLYDNALLARIYLRAGQVLGDQAYTATAVETLDYLAGEMRDPGGGIHAAEDADSEGVEGKYYVWTWDEFTALAGDDADLVGRLYGVTPDGNFEGANNLHLSTTPQELAAASGLGLGDVMAAKSRVDDALLRTRRTRIPPGRDDKVIASWNGLALRAFAEAAAVLDSAEYLDVAVGIARFVTTEMVDGTGRLQRAWRKGRCSGPGFCDDYAAMAVGLYTLYSVSGDASWYTAAERLVSEMIDLFGGADGFFTPGSDASDLIARPKDFADNPLPSANSLAAEALVIHSAFTGDTTERVNEIARGAGRILERYPSAAGHLLAVLITIDSGIKEVAIVGQPEQRRQLHRVIWERFRPDCVAAMGSGDGRTVPLLRGRDTVGDAAAAHVCRSFVCNLPVTTPDALRAGLDG